MSGRRRSRSSQGTDMMESLRFPDAIEFEEVVKNCNCLAQPLASRSITNKCYILLWKAAYFSSSVFIGVKHVQDTLDAMRDERVPCLVLLAADTFIGAEMTRIVITCKTGEIPYIFIPTKRAMRDALSVNNDVLAVLIAFNHDPGMRREFEDCFLSISCRKKRKREPSSHATSPITVPPEVGPRGEMPQQVTTAVSTVPPGQVVSALVGEPGPSSRSDWITISSDSDFSDDSAIDKTTSRDFSVNVPDESGSSFQEYVRIPSPTPAPSPSEMVAQQKNEMPSTPDETVTACSSDESLISGPSREFAAPASPPRPQNLPHRQTAWPIPLPYAPKEDFDDENVKMYLQTICGKKKLRLRCKTSVPPMCTNPQPPFGQDYRQCVAHPRPSTTTQTPATSQSGDQSQPIDIDWDDISFSWTMDDLSSTSNEALVDLTSYSTTDSPTIQLISSDEEEKLMTEESTAITLQYEGASGDGNVCPMDTSESSSAVSIATPELSIGDGASSSLAQSNICTTTPFALGDNATITSTSSGVEIRAPMASFHGLGDVRSPNTIPSSSAMGDARSIPQCHGFTDLPPIPSIPGQSDDFSSLSSRGMSDVCSTSSSLAYGSIPTSRELSYTHSTPSCRRLGGAPSGASLRGSYNIPPIPPFRGEATSNLASHGIGDTPSSFTIGGFVEVAAPIIPSSRSPGFGDSQAGPSQRISNIHASTSTSGGLGDVPPMPSPSAGVGDVPAVPATSGEVGDADVGPSRPRVVTTAGEGSIQIGMTFPSAFGDAWPIGVHNPNVFHHRVSGTGEGHQPAFMPNNLSFIFAPRIVYTTAANQDGRRGMWNTLVQGIPTEEDILAIPFPGGEDDNRMEHNHTDQNIPEGSDPMEITESDDLSDESDDSSDESELSTDGSVVPPNPFEFED